MKECLLFLSIAVLVSCEDYVKFESPQPLNSRDLTQIPRPLRGDYFSETDSTYLTINQRVIIDWVDLEFKGIPDSLDLEIDSTKITVQADDFTEIVDGKYRLGIQSLSNSDSVLVRYSYRDTIFNISDEHVLRRFKGHYFLNYRMSANDWKVRRLSRTKKELSFSKIILPEDIEKLKEITSVQELRSDSGRVIGYKLNPTKAELKKLMKHQFNETKTYKKLD